MGRGVKKKKAAGEAKAKNKEKDALKALKAQRKKNKDEEFEDIDAILKELKKQVQWFDSYYYPPTISLIFSLHPT